MNELGLILEYLHPGKEEHYEIRGSDNGPYLFAWNEATLGPQPTKADLQAVWIPALKEQKMTEVRRRAEAETEAVMPRYARERAGRDMARGRSPRTERQVSDLDAIADKAMQMEDYINDPARTEAELLVLNWDGWRG